MLFGTEHRWFTTALSPAVPGSEFTLHGGMGTKERLGVTYGVLHVYHGGKGADGGINRSSYPTYILRKRRENKSGNLIGDHGKQSFVRSAVVLYDQFAAAPIETEREKGKIPTYCC